MSTRLVTIYFRHQRGGLCLRLYRLIERCLEDGGAVTALSAEPLAIAPAERLRLERVPVPVPSRAQPSNAVPSPSGTSFWGMFALLAPISLVRACARDRPDAVVVFDPFYAVLAAPAARLTRTALVLFVRGVPWRARAMTGSGRGARRLARLLDRIGLRVADRVVAMTSAMRRELEQEVPGIRDRVSLLPNAVPRWHELGLPHRGAADGAPRPSTAAAGDEGPGSRARGRAALPAGALPDGFVLVTSGVLTPRKNIEVLLCALALPAATAGVPAPATPRLGLLVLGDGPARADLEATCARLGLAERVRFAGWCEQPAAWVAGCDAFVLPSTHEGMSNALLEAMALGLPVLAAETPETRELLVHGDLLVAPEPRALRARLDVLAADPAERQRLTALTRERAEALSFDWAGEALRLIEAAAAGASAHHGTGP